MPAIASHFIVACMALEKADDAVKAAVEKAPGAFFLGVQGPDALFFRRYSSDSALRKLGSRVHKTDAFLLFSAFVDKLNELDSVEADAYVYGFACHLAADSALHPVVYAAVDQEVKNGAKAATRELHQKIEYQLDHAVIRSFSPNAHYKHSPASFRTYRTLKTKGKNVDAAAEILRCAVESSLGERVELKHIKQAIRGMKKSQRLLYSRFGVKYRLAALVEKIAGKPDFITCHMRPASLYRITKRGKTADPSLYRVARKDVMLSYAMRDAFIRISDNAALLMGDLYYWRTSGVIPPRIRFAVNFAGETTYGG